MYEDFEGIFFGGMPNIPRPPAFKNDRQQFNGKHVRRYRFNILNCLVKEDGIVALGKVYKKFFFRKKRIFVRLKQPC